VFVLEKTLLRDRKNLVGGFFEKLIDFCLVWLQPSYMPFVFEI
jgi:hypothetical protein